MNLIHSVTEKIVVAKKILVEFSIKTKVIIVLIIITLGWFTIPKIINSKTQKPQYQTAMVERGTLVSSITVSGQVSSANSAVVSTQASGVVSGILVKNGQKVKAGDPIAQIDLDLEGKQRSAQVYASYQNAKNNLNSAQTNLYSLQSDMLTKWKSYMDIAQSSLYQNSDNSPKNDTRQLPQFMSTNDDWLATEAKYKNQQNVISQAQTSLNNAWLSYQQASLTVYAPISGTVTGLSLQIGSVLTAQSNSSGTSTSQKIASIKTNAHPTVIINLTEIDAPKVKIGNKATVTLDAFRGKTYTGQVVSIDTVGAVSSGVTTYPTVIKFDTEVGDIFSNMSVQASIIIQTKDNILLIPSSAVQTQNEQSLVRIIKNGQVQQIPVETGISSNSQVEITSGLTEGDTIVSNVITGGTGQQSNSQTQSPFGGLGGGAFRGGGFGGGGGGMRRD